MTAIPIHFRGKTKVGYTVDVPIRAFTYPAGEAEIKVGDEFNPEDYEYLIADVRGYDSHTLFHLAMFGDYVRNINDEQIDGTGLPWYLFMPYFPGARADRGNPVGAAVYADFVNELGADKVVIVDPHSEVIVGLLGGVQVFPVERIIKREIQDGSSDSRPHPYVGVIAPDHGAVDRATAAAKVMGVPVYKAGKTRDFNTGKLAGFHMEDELPTEGKLLIVDDICDGGGTFVGLARATGLTRDRVDLWVTHGVFSKGFDELRRHFDVIHTTNSYFQGGRDPFVKTHDVTPYLYEALQA